MRRSRIGDVYATKVPNGYKLYQRAYDIPKKGKFIRVFEGLYDSIPDNIAPIVDGPHSYIIDFPASGAYRLGLAQFIGNYPVPEKYPFPNYEFTPYQSSDGIISQIEINRTDLSSFQVYRVSQMKDLPEEFRELKLLGWALDPPRVLYLVDINWSPANLSSFKPGRSKAEFTAILQKYVDMVAEARKKLDNGGNSV